MNRLQYDQKTQRVSLTNLSTLVISDKQQEAESVQDFILRIEQRQDRTFKLDLNDNITLGKQMLEDNVYRGVVLEGIPATYAQTCEIINNIPVKSDLKPSQINEIVSLKRAWEYVLNKDVLRKEVDLDLVKTIHAVIGANMESLDPHQVGRLRETPIYVGGVKNHDFGIPDEAQVICELNVLNSFDDPVVKALETYLYLCIKQMFRDGNKRTANLAANLLLIQNGAGLLSIKEELVPDFKILLVDWYENSNKKDIMNFLLNKCYIYNYVGKSFLD